MNFRRSNLGAGAFTLVELLCVIAIIGILAALLLPALNQSQARAKRIGCVNHLRQMGIAFQLFSHDHNDQFPMFVPAADGGAREFVQNGYAVGGPFYFSFRQFQSLSNELGAPAILACPSDLRLRAADFSALQNSNLSYFIGVKAAYARPDSILAGDRNLTANVSPNPSILHIEPGNPLRWTGELHQFKGNILFAGGQVEEWNNAALASAGNEHTGTDLFMPTVLPDPGNTTSASTTSTSGGYRSYPVANPNAGAPRPASPAVSPAFAPAYKTSNDRSGSGPTLTRTNGSGSPATIVTSDETISPDETEATTLTFDQHVVKTARRIIFGTYLLVLLIFLLLLAFKAWQRAQQKRAQRQHLE